MSRQPYIRPMSKTTWYMRHGRYRIYMLREITSLLVAFYTFLVIVALARLASGSPQEWNDFLLTQQTPFMIGFHAFALVYFLVFQMFPWFKLAPKAMPVQLGERKAPDSAIIAGHYVVWIVLSAAILWLAGVF